MSDLTAILLPPLITAVLGGAGLWIQDWRQSRDQRFQRKQAREEGEETIAFFQKWLDAEKALCSPEEFEQVKARTREELDKAYQQLLATHENKTRFQAYPLFQRALLLYKPTKTLGWAAHALFYLLGVVFVLMSISLVLPSDSPDTQPLTWLEIIVTDAFFFLPVLAARAWAVEVDTHHPLLQPAATVAAGAAATSPTVGRALLSDKPGQASS